MNVLIVESPSKAKSINKYLGDNFKVLASVGHVRDLTAKNDFTFNTASKKIETTNAILVYDIRGKLVLTTKEKSTTISHLKNGIYILKSENKTQKIILN